MSYFGAIRDALTDLTAGVAARAQTPTGNALQVQIGPGDIISTLPVMIDYDHHQIHEGETFRWSAYVASLANNADKFVRIVVPSITIPGGVNPVARCPHFRFEFISSVDANFYFYETPTTTGNGTQGTARALERNGAYTPQLQIREDPTVTGNGTLLWQGITTSTKQNSGGFSAIETEFVLKNNTVYLLRANSLSNSNRVLIRMVWYEDLDV